MKSEEEIEKMIESIREEINNQINLKNHDEEFYSNYSGRKEALQWVLNEEELKKHLFMKEKEAKP